MAKFKTIAIAMNVKKQNKIPPLPSKHFLMGFTQSLPQIPT